jgi:hypothetical protein
MSFFRRTTKPPPAAATVANLENVVQRIDQCMVDDHRIRSSDECGNKLAQLMTAERVRCLSDEEYTHLLLTLDHASWGELKPAWLEGVLVLLAVHATRQLLDEALHDDVSAWSEDALANIYVRLLFAIARKRTNIPDTERLVGVLCQRIVHKTVPLVDSTYDQWEALFALVPALEALLLLSQMDNTYRDKFKFFPYVGARLEAGPVEQTIDALLGCSHLWTTTAAAAASPLGAQIWAWLVSHPTWSRALEACDAACHAPLEGWLLVRTHYQQLPHLLGDPIALFADLCRRDWARTQPTLLVDVVRALEDSCLCSLDAASVLAQAWPFMREELRQRVVDKVLNTSAPPSPKDALRMAITFGAIVPPDGQLVPQPLNALVCYALSKASLDAIAALDQSEFADGEPRVYHTLALACRTTDKASRGSFEQLMAHLAVRCTETQLCQLSGTMDAGSLSRLYDGMVRLAPQPKALPRSLLESKEQQRRDYLSFSTRLSRAWRLRSILVRLAQHEGWADFSVHAGTDASTRASLASRKQVLEEAYRVHLAKDLARLCVAFI